MKTETPEQFFSAIKIPPTWRYIGRNDINVGEGNYWNNFGFVYQTPDNKMMRLFFTPKAGVGGFVEKDLKTEKYRCLLDNKTSEGINQFLKERYE